AYRDIARDGAHPVADQRFCLVQLAIAAAHDEDIRPFVDEPMRGRQPDTAAAAGDYGDLASQSCHQLILHISCGVVDVLMRRLFLWPRSRSGMASPVRRRSRGRSW